MSAELSSGGKHSLRRFLDDLVWKHFFDDVRLEEPGVTQYVSKMLVDFVDVGNLYRLQNAQGKRSEEHTSELQSRGHLVCRLLLEKKKKKKKKKKNRRKKT